MRFNKSDRLTVVLVSLFFAMAFFSRCAQPAAPQGGPRDTIPPILLSVKPANNTTNFDAKEVVFTFNEYIQLKDQQKQILISPPMNAKPTFTLRGKNIIMRLPEDLVLDSNTTYKIDFGSAIVDNNEGNVAKRFEYIFSTGDYIDTLVMTGQLIDAATGEKIINGIALLFANEKMGSDTTKGDSTLFIGRRLAIARTDSSGNFIATNLKGIDYRVFGLKDANDNMTYEVGEELVGLSNKLYNPLTMKDFNIWIDPIRDIIEVSPQMRLELFNESSAARQDINEITRPLEYQLLVTFDSDSAKIEEIIIDSLTSENIIIDNLRQDDSVRVWIKPTGDEFTLPDTLKGIISFYKSGTDGGEVLDTADFELSFFKAEEKGSGAVDKVAQKFDSFFKKIGDWFSKVFMGKKKRMALAIMARNKVVADSLKQIELDSLYKLRLADSLAIADSLLVIAKRDSIANAELGLINSADTINRDSIAKLTLKFSLSGDVSPEDELYISSEYPMALDTALIDVVRLSFAERSEDFFAEDAADQVEEKPTIETKESFTITRDSIDMTRWLLNVDWQPKSDYKITFHNDAARDIIGAVNDSITSNISTLDPSESSIVTVKVKLMDSLANNNYIVSLLDSANVEVQSKMVSGQNDIHFRYVVPKKYKVKFVNDTNGNGIQDMGILTKNIEPERVEIYYIEKDDPLFETTKGEDITIEVHPEALFDDKIKEKLDAMKREEEEEKEKEKEENELKEDE